MVSMVALQIVMPMLMLVWLASARPSSRVGLALHVIATAAWSLAIALCGVWTLLPWWTPHAFAVSLGAVAAWRMTLLGRLPRLPRESRAWIGATFCLVITAVALWQVAAAIAGREEPGAPIADISSPLPQGSFLVVNGGSDARVNAHLKTLSPDTPRFREWRGQSYGIDLVQIDRFGFRARGLRPRDPSAYVGFGSPVVAPCSGRVVRAVDGVEDNAVPQTNREQMAGNHVIVRCDGFDVVLAHLRRGSVTLETGDYVATGSPVGALGNSGNSDEPHLHVHAQRSTLPASPFSADPIPLRIDGRFLVRGDRVERAADVTRPSQRGDPCAPCDR